MRSEDFTTGLILNEKAVTEHDGDLWIEGWAADVSLDDQDEYFAKKALEDAAAEFMASGNTPLLLSHDPKHLMGEVTLLEPRQRARRQLRPLDEGPRGPARREPPRARRRLPQGQRAAR